MENSTKIPDPLALWASLSEIQKAIINRDGFLYACAYEVRLNLSLIDALDEKKLSELKLDSPAFKELAGRFQISATLALLTGSERKNHRRLIKLLSKLEVENKETFEPENEKGNEALENEKDYEAPVKNTIEYLNFVVNKIQTLRIIAEVYNDEQNVFKKIKLNTRIKNIEKALIAVQKPLKKAIDRDQNRLIKNFWFWF